jgi:hypothetical protein
VGWLGGEGGGRCERVEWPTKRLWVRTAKSISTTGRSRRDGRKASRSDCASVSEGRVPSACPARRVSTTMDVDDDPMEITMRQETAAAPPNTEVMLDAADDFSDFGNLGDINQPKYTISSHDSMQPVIQDPTIGIESFSSFGGGVRPGGSLDALGLAGMEMSQPQTSLASATVDPTPPPM